jgi:hypothetical protein
MAKESQLQKRRPSPWLLLGLLASACSGRVAGMNDEGSPGGSDGHAGGNSGSGVNVSSGGTSGPSVTDMSGATLAVPRGGARRLSRSEMDGALSVLLGGASIGARQTLSEENMEKKFAFDNNYELNHSTSQSYIESLESLTEAAVKTALADPKSRAAMVPCTPAGAKDVACMTAFVKDFGRVAFRRPLDAEEVTYFSGFTRFAEEGADFYLGVQAAARAMLISPEFTYRLEIGTPVSGRPAVFKLSPYELASRLSFTLLGAPPNRSLLDAVDAGDLDTVDGIRAAAVKLLGDARAKQRVYDYHSSWLGYRGNLPSAQAASMLEETQALIDDVVFGKTPDYKQLFLSKRTFVGDQLRDIYTDLGAPKTGKAGWVDYGASGRAGILSHAAVLNSFKTGDDTSPTKRGWFVRMRLMCDDIPEPPPNVSADVSVSPTQCKTGPDGFYIKSHQGTSCKACHENMDPVGFGLEGYDILGRKRSADIGKPNCKIDGKGFVVLTDPQDKTTSVNFSGPGELGKVLVDSGKINSCVARHVYRFVVGRLEDDAEEANITQLAKDFAADGNDFGKLMVEAVSHPAFAFRFESNKDGSQ